MSVRLEAICTQYDLRKCRGISHFHSNKMLRLLTFLALVIQITCIYEESITIEPNYLRIRLNSFNEKGTQHHHRYVVINTAGFPKNPKREDRSSDNVSFKWGDTAELSISKMNHHCELFEFRTTGQSPLTMTFDISHVFLYGGPETLWQSWPIQNEFQSVPYVTAEKLNQAVVERYWLASDGSYIYVDERVPLFLTQNKTILQLTAHRREPYTSGNDAFLKCRICSFENVRVAHEHAIANVLGKPNKVPDFRMLQHPIWSTWARYKVHVSESVVLKFAKEITDHGYKNSQLEIDDDWEVCYGGLTENTKKFPDFKKVVSQLHDMGYRVTVWVHPFVNTNCQPYFDQGVRSNYFVKDGNGSVISKWWNGPAAHIDFTNPAAKNWYITRLHDFLKRTGVDSLKFDAGETTFCPPGPVYHKMSDDFPDTITKEYVNAVAVFGDMIEVRVGRGTQHVGRFLRMIDRNSTWIGDVGLNTVIPTLLLLNILGYPYVLPDMIGGNGYGDQVVKDELFIRWLQMNVFMASLQFSYVPWDYSGKTPEICKKFVDLHSAYTPLIYDLMVEATKTGAPVNRPLWWADPTDPNTYTIDSEFLLGDNILVAPVLKEGARSRDIYIPKGYWKDENCKRSTVIVGPKLLQNYAADLDTLPYFTRVDNIVSPSGSPSLFTATTLVLLLCILLMDYIVR